MCELKEINLFLTPVGDSYKTSRRESPQMIGNACLGEQKGKPVLEKQSGNKDKSIPSMKNEISEDMNVSCIVHVHATASKLTKRGNYRKP